MSRRVWRSRGISASALGMSRGVWRSPQSSVLRSPRASVTPERPHVRYLVCVAFASGISASALGAVPMR
eukprot:6043655-Alexandrium_andersonii.AAC.1